MGGHGTGIPKDKKKDKSLKKKKNVTKTGNAGRRIPAVSEGFPFFAGKKT